MDRQYNFIKDSINEGRTVLVYKPCSKVKHVRSMDRVEMRGGVVFVDGVSAKGWTICRKP